ncbi:MAG: S8 family serine peptidase, partial [Actinomycetota bacterium]
MFFSKQESPSRSRLLNRLSVIATLLLIGMIASFIGVPASAEESPSPSPAASADATPSSDASPSSEATPSPDAIPSPDATEAATPDASPSDVASPSDTTPSPAGTPSTTSLIVRLIPNLSATQQSNVIERNGGTETSSIPALRLHVVDVPSADAAADTASYRADADVESVDVDRTRVAEAAPSDPAYGSQWALPKIGWDSAYDNVAPNGNPVIAILDTGVDSSLTDLSGRLVGGYSAIGADASSDPNGHGTWMASIAAAGANNADGIAGVDYAQASVMPVQVLGADGTGQDSDIISGVVWAANHGADVILMSFSNPGFSSALQDAVDYAWSRGAIIVAATGNDGSSAAHYPAGDARVVGVSATDQDDALWSGSNYGAATFIAAPGVNITADAAGGGSASVTGTSASAAIVAGAAALLKANDPNTSNGTIVGRLARNADAAGTSEQTGNGRVNIARALADDSTDAVVPAGAGASGGPLVGPYVIGAPQQLSGSLQSQNNPPCSTPLPCPWQTSTVSGWAELQTVPFRLFFAANQNGRTNTYKIDVDHTAGGSQGLDGLIFGLHPNITMSAIIFSSSTNGAGATTWSYTFDATADNDNAGEIDFTTRLLAGAHAFTGSSLQVKGSSGAGNIGFSKPAAAPGTPDLVVSKSGPTFVVPGQTLTYTLSYRNLATGSNSATGALLTDNLPSTETYVNGSCSGCTFDSLSNTLYWNLGTIAAGSALATKTFQVTVASTGLNNGNTIVNAASLYSAETDADTITSGRQNNTTFTSTVAIPAIGGTVLSDIDADGANNDGGIGISGATVALYQDANNDNTWNPGGATPDPLVASVITGGTGDFIFNSGLSAGTQYFIVRTNPAGYTSTQAIVGTGTNSPRASSSNVKVSNDVLRVSLGAAPAFNSNNYFLAQPRNASIAGKVWNDVDQSNTGNGTEVGISGVTVSLSGGTPAITPTATTTAADGTYSFGSLPPGTYSVDYTVPATYTNNGTKPLVVVLGASQASTANDFFAHQQSGSIAGTVWNDSNGDGLAASESGLGGVTVSLSGTTSGATTTAADGTYSFGSLGAGSYTVSFTPPTGYLAIGASSIGPFALASGQNLAGKDFFARRATSTSLALTTGTNPSTYGDSLTFTVTVTSLAGNATTGNGTVTFKDGATTICSAVALGGVGANKATCTLSTLNVAGSPHSITAEYSGATTTSGWSGSTSVALPQTVNPKPVTVTTANAGKAYGDGDPSPLTSANLGGFVASDNIDATFSRAPGSG